MKKWPVALTSTIIAMGLLIYFFPHISFTDKALDFKPPVLTSKTEVEDAAVSPTVTVACTSRPVIEVKATASPVPTNAPHLLEAESTPTALPLLTPALPVEATPMPEIAVSDNLPVITITGETHPGCVTINNVVNIRGIINTDSGTITHVSAKITLDDVVIQSCSYSPNTDYFSLAGTVNADLHFAQLGVGTYKYVLYASAKNNSGTSDVTLIDDVFEVVSAGSSKSEEPNGGAGGYVARLSSDTDNAALIWNFLITQLDNPYAAAGIMANMEAESSLLPTASQGDTPACGYGLCQWTQYRKERLAEFAQLAETDISDLDLQLCFLIYELDSYYPNLKQFLLNVGDGSLAASEFCAVYEQSASYGRRGTYAQKYLDRFALP